MKVPLVKEPKILVVDDQPNVEEEIQTGLTGSAGLTGIGIKPVLMYHCPKSRAEPFGGCKLPVGSEWDGYDLALIDLELFPLLHDTMEYASEDLLGGTAVLPYIRTEAPWLPIIGYSRLFSSSPGFFAIAGSFGFDAHLNRGLFSHRDLSPKLWEYVTRAARLHRLRAVLGAEANPDVNPPTVEVAREIAAKLDEDLPAWRNTLETLFYFAKEISLDLLPGGWSGAQVLRVDALGTPGSTHESGFGDYAGGVEGTWLVKLSTSPSKLHREAVAHRRAIIAGVPFARIVPLLWQDVLVVEPGVAALAYQFARDTVNGLECLKAGMTVKNLCVRIRGLLEDLHGTSFLRRSDGGNAKRLWGGDADRMAKAAKALGKCQAAGRIESLLEGKAPVGSVNTRRVTFGRIHGDLHLANTMFGDRDVLVDFSNAGIGPIMADYAKLVADVMGREESARQLPLPDLSRFETLPDYLKELVPANTSTEDAQLFGDLLELRLAQLLTFPDIHDNAKQWVRAALSD